MLVGEVNEAITLIPTTRRRVFLQKYDKAQWFVNCDIKVSLKLFVSLRSGIAKWQHAYFYCSGNVHARRKTVFTTRVLFFCITDAGWRVFFSSDCINTRLNVSK